MGYLEKSLAKAFVQTRTWNQNSPNDLLWPFFPEQLSLRLFQSRGKFVLRKAAATISSSNRKFCSASQNRRTGIFSTTPRLAPSPSGQRNGTGDNFHDQLSKEKESTKCHREDKQQSIGYLKDLATRKRYQETFQHFENIFYFDLSSDYTWVDIGNNSPNCSLKCVHVTACKSYLKKGRKEEFMCTHKNVFQNKYNSSPP